MNAPSPASARRRLHRPLIAAVAAVTLGLAVLPTQAGAGAGARGAVATSRGSVSASRGSVSASRGSLAAHSRPRIRTKALRDPSGNRTLSQSTLWACETSPSGSTCTNSVLTAIDKARAGEGVRPMRLPTGFASLTIPLQLFVLANLERTDRGLASAIGLSRGLDQSALSGARSDADPVPKPFYGSAFGSNWAGGIGSTLAVDFLWMYDDGPGSSNIDCRAAGDAGCWGHRNNILYPYQVPLAMGAAVSGGNSMTEVFVGGDLRTRPGQADAPIAFAASR